MDFRKRWNSRVHHGGEVVPKKYLDKKKKWAREEQTFPVVDSLYCFNTVSLQLIGLFYDFALHRDSS